MLTIKLFLILLLNRVLATENVLAQIVVKNACKNAIKNANEHDAKKVLLLQAHGNENQENQGLQGQQNENEEIQDLDKENQVGVLDNCPICYLSLDDETKIVTAICNGYRGHRFHSECIKGWLEYQRNKQRDESCPVCRKLIHEVHAQISVNDFLNLGNQLPQIINQQYKRLKAANLLISFSLVANIYAYSDQISFVAAQVYSMVNPILPSPENVALLLKEITAFNSNIVFFTVLFLVEYSIIEFFWRRLAQHPSVKHFLWFLFFLTYIILQGYYIVYPFILWAFRILYPPSTYCGNFDAMFAHYKAPTNIYFGLSIIRVLVADFFK